MLADLRQRYEALDEETRIAAASVIIPAVLDHARQGGSYRFLIYDRLGFSEASYVPLQLAGVLDASNELSAVQVPLPDDVAAALKLLQNYAKTFAKQDSGMKDAHGHPILFPSQAANDCFNAIDTIEGLYQSLCTAKEALTRAVASSPATPPTPDEQAAGANLASSVRPASSP